jgi:branched-chain amino acid transport system ATP-binding protein
MKDQTIIETKHATKEFSGLVAVDNVDFGMAKGEAVGIIGPNGAGKTTFFNLLTGLFPVSSGNIYFEGKDVTATPSYERVMMGIVRTFQLVSVFDSLTVAENLVLSRVRFGEEYASKGRFFLSSAQSRRIMDSGMESLHLLGIDGKAPLATAELSYGDKRKLEIAVALSMKPKILLLDEPFAGLSDSEITEVSVIINEHKISRILDIVERLCVMHEGRLIAQGVPGEVLEDPMVREVYWGKEEGLVCSV